MACTSSYDFSFQTLAHHECNRGKFFFYSTLVGLYLVCKFGIKIRLILNPIGSFLFRGPVLRHIRLYFWFEGSAFTLSFYVNVLGGGKSGTCRSLVVFAKFHGVFTPSSWLCSAGTYRVITLCTASSGHGLTPLEALTAWQQRKQPIRAFILINRIGRHTMLPNFIQRRYRDIEMSLARATRARICKPQLA